MPRKHPPNPRRYEFYKRGRATYAVTTCACCRMGHYQDAWLRTARELTSVGLSRSTIASLTLITEAEAYRRAPDLIQAWEAPYQHED